VRKSVHAADKARASSTAWLLVPFPLSWSLNSMRGLCFSVRFGLRFLFFGEQMDWMSYSFAIVLLVGVTSKARTLCMRTGGRACL
jgi:membrane protein YdbS with pleckstrin-like domain